nr:eukaryotic translation initiation factor 4b:4h [Hymenolepis microstoma]
MTKKKNNKRFNQTLDIDFRYANTSIVDGIEADPAVAALSSEEKMRLHQMKASLPSAPQAVRIEEDVAKIPDSGPFRVAMNNVPYTAKKADIEGFFHPLVPLYINMDDSGQNHGFCTVDFASKVDLIEALRKNDTALMTRNVSIRIANSNDNRGSYGSRNDFGNRRNYGGYFSGGQYNYGRSDGVEGQSSGGWVRRSVNLPKSPPAQVSQGSMAPSSFRRSNPGAPSGATAAPPMERPRINLLPRSKPLNTEETEAAVSDRQKAIFGEARPVDIVAHEREIEEVSSSDAGDINNEEQPQAAPRKPGNAPRKNAWARPLVPPKN